MTFSVLSRTTQSSFRASPELNPLQSQVDGLVSHFVEEAANPITMASMMAGGLAYRMGRVGVMGSAVGEMGQASLRMASITVGLGSEVTAFELTNRALQTIRAHSRATLQTQNPNLWSWSGPGGWVQGLASSAVTFGMLRGAGFLAREENFVLQHAFQSTAMVAGHHVVGALGVTPRPEGSLAEQFLHAEATNLQMSAGMGLVHSMAPRISAVERGLDLSLRFNDVGAPLGAPSIDMHPSERAQSHWDFLRSQASAIKNLLNPFRLQPAAVGPSPPQPSPSRERVTELMGTVMMSENRQKDGGGSSSRKVQRREFWFPIRGGRGTPLQIEYSGEAKEQIDQLESQIRRANRDLEHVRSREELLARRPDENLVNAVWLHQLRHLARAVKAEVREFVDPEQLLVPLKLLLRLEQPEVLREAVRRMREEGLGEDAFRVVELEIPFEEVHFGRPDRKERSTGLFYILESIEGELRNTVRIGEAEKGKGRMTVRFMSPSLFERLLQIVHGPEAPLLFYVEGEIPQNLSMRLKTLGASPIGISRESLRLEDLEVKVHPGFFTLHDLYHASMITNFPRSLRQFIGWLYDLAVSDRRLKASVFLKEHLNRLTDMDPPMEKKGGLVPFFEHTFRHLATHFREDYEGKHFTMGRLLKYRHFLKNYRDLLRENPPRDPKWKNWHREFSGEVEKVYQTFDELLKQINQAYLNFLKQK